ncbi:hypothetical protein GLAREA_03510 [Glarea lozoyensis ATCC 20868]|uniref:2EXR domain-containing protein n=1 Tax=Glarea lozoyensis (strain ATCC 20868 / MF5171) TaxID=1116229 RepID=S3DVX5_GLAL2|nr:uncharacterized protein GLAREA_03510 [Glarea lozoyensis ATCC 20868]EPE30543.1 hypothetical protein GLAREA_03510 [Glarea lozoyensis ATCC 20868]
MQNSCSVTQSFPLNRLATELRIKIWSFAFPEPAWIIQVPHPTKLAKFTYTRPVPAILQVCKEARDEYIDTDAVELQALVKERRKRHPVYKLCLAKDGESPVYFSYELDTFCGLRYSDETLQENGEVCLQIRVDQTCAIRKLDICHFLQHLALEYTPRVQSRLHEGDNEASVLRALFPALKTLTYVASACIAFPRVLPVAPIVAFPAPPEMDPALSMRINCRGCRIPLLQGLKRIDSDFRWEVENGWGLKMVVVRSAEGVVGGERVGRDMVRENRYTRQESSILQDYFIEKGWEGMW